MELKMVLVVDPTDFQTIYACTWAGLHKSTDGGENWTFIFPLPYTEEVPPVSFVAVDPDDGGILYAGIGNADGNEDGTGSLYRSTDGGATWELLDVGMPDEAVVHSVVIDPTSPAENRSILVSTDGGVFRSEDNGGTWTDINAGLPHLNARRLGYSTSGGNLTLFLTLKTEGDSANLDSFKGGIYKSTDGGDNWISINGDLATVPYEDPNDPPPFYDFWKFAIHPTNSDIMYIATNLGGWGDLWGIRQTVDGGAHWTKIDTAITYGWLDNQWWNEANITVLEIAPSAPDMLIAGGDFVRKTTNAGQTWEQVYTTPVGNHWAGRGIELLVPFDVAFDPTDPNILYVGYDDMGFWRSDDGGQSFARLDEVQIGDFDAVNSIAVGGTTGDVYVGRNRGTNDEADGYVVGQVWKSADQGESSTVVGNGLPEGRPVLVMDNANSVLYAAIYGQGVYKTTDGGQAWSRASNGLGSDAAFAWTLVIDPANPQTLYLGLNTLAGTGSGGVYKTQDGGQNWTKLNGIPSDDVLSVAVHPSNSQTLYVGLTQDYSWTTSGGGYKSTDGGETWVKVLDQPRISVVLVHPTQTDAIFAASQPWWNHISGVDSGLYRSLDGGQTWELISENLGHAFILFARINLHNPDQIFVGTHGGGLWVGDQILLTSGPSEPATPWDVNSDGVVNIVDLVLVGSQFGGSGDNLSEDINDDGKVDIIDLVLVGSHFGESTGAAPLWGKGMRRHGKYAIRNTQYAEAPIRRAIDALEAMPERPHGAEIAIAFLRAWLANVNSIPPETKLLPNFPNPFNPEMWMPYQLAEDTTVLVGIYDSDGQLLRKLALGLKPAGFYLTPARAAYWDGRNQFGERVSSGVYFYRVTAGDFSATRKMVILK